MSYDSDVEVVLCIQAPEKKNVKESKSQVVSHPSSMKQPPRKVPSSSNTKDIVKNPPRKVPRSYPLMMKDKKPLPVKPNLKDAAMLVDLTQGPEDDDDTPLVVAPKTPTKTTPKEKFQSPGPVKQTPPQRVQDEVMFIGTTTPTKPPSAVSSTKNPKKVSKKSLVAKSQPPKKMEPPLKPASKSAPQRLSPNKVAFSLSPEMVARLPQRKQSPFGFDVNYSSDDDIGTLRKRKREKQRKKKNIDQGTDDRKPAAKPRAPAPSFGEQVSLAGRPRPREFDAARPDKKQSPTPRTKGSPPAASRDSNTKSDASLNLERY